MIFYVEMKFFYGGAAPGPHRELGGPWTPHFRLETYIHLNPRYTPGMTLDGFKPIRIFNTVTIK